ncbi:LOW QUALITY PROTEIN: butyrophilin-like protein 1 [Rhynchocyon petersi]
MCGSLADWRKEQFQAWFVTLDQSFTPPNAVFNQENTNVTYVYDDLEFENCSVLGRPGITSGLRYWEVEVRNGHKETFLVKGPSLPIVAELGENTMLPCSVYPAMNVENMELRWFRSHISEVVFFYQNQQEQWEEQMPQYAGRTSLVKDLLTFGEAAVRVDKVQPSDNGLYTCLFKKGGFYQEATLELQVAGIGSTPEVQIQGPKEEGVHVVCMTPGWFPKPQVQWRDLSGEKFLVFSESHTDTQGLFHVESSLVVKDSTARNVTCSIFNPIMGQEKAKAIFIPEPFFPQTSPWIPVFAVTTILGLLIFGAGYVLKKERSAKMQEWEEQKNLEQPMEEDRQIKEEALKIRDGLQKELDWRKKVYQTAWRKAQLYADWRKEQFQAWFVTLDPSFTPPNAVFNQENTNVTYVYDALKPEECSVLGLQGITSGLCYWEVEVRNGDKGVWSVGVCRKDVGKNQWIQKEPDNGFWVIRQNHSIVFACTYPKKVLRVGWRQIPCQIGIFLDYDGGDISFYNMIDGSHIFSFSKTSFSGALFPYFMLRSYYPKESVSLSIVHVPKEFPKLNRYSLDKPLSSPRKELNSGSFGGSILPGPKSPLLHQNFKDVSP